MCASMADIHSATAEIRRGKKEAEELECGPMPKIAMGTIAQLCRAISSQLRHVWTIEKKRVKQQYDLHMSLQYGELRPTSG